MKLNSLIIGDLEAKVPIIQGGMGVGVSLSSLAGAVAKEGAIGVISAAQPGFLEEDFGKDSLTANIRALGKHIKKAKEISKITNMPCIADDSGLCIDIFDGWPGIYTARFLGENSTPEQRNTAILEKMKDLKEEERKARARCVITYYDNGEIIVGKGEIEGKITKKPRGENGFGFDPIFELKNGKTMAELTKEEKNLISHRKKALENLKKQLTTK